MLVAVSLDGHVGEELVGGETGEKEINGFSPFSCWLTGLSAGIFELDGSLVIGAFDGIA